MNEQRHLHEVLRPVVALLPDPEEWDADELRARLEMTRTNGLDLAGRLADLSVAHPDGDHDAVVVVEIAAVAASLLEVLRVERQLRRLLKAAVAG